VRDQLAEVAVPGSILDEHVERGAGLEGQLGSHERTDAEVLGGAEKAWCAVNAVAIAEGECSVAEVHRLVDEVLGERRTAQEAERALAAELDVRIGYGLQATGYRGK
jgi:hypothetical protein